MISEMFILFFICVFLLFMAAWLYSRCEKTACQQILPLIATQQNKVRSLENLISSHNTTLANASINHQKLKEEFESLRFEVQKLISEARQFNAATGVKVDSLSHDLDYYQEHLGKVRETVIDLKENSANRNISIELKGQATKMLQEKIYKTKIKSARKPKRKRK